MPKGLSLLCIYFGFSAVLYSLPQQGAVVTGKAEIVQTNDLLQITASDRAILTWDSFSIQKAETLRFLQPSDQSAVLNRVIGLSASLLDGQLQANGQVYLINPNGLIVGKDAVINTASFIGTTLQIPNDDFLNNANLRFQGDSIASIIHLGTIHSSQGPVTLIAHRIENEGKITASGTVSLIAGHEILLSASGDLLHVRPDIQADGIESSGAIQALQTRIESDGIRGLGVRQVDEPKAKIVTVGGKILLRAEKSPIAVSGELAATGDTGGRVHILGETVTINNGASIDASGTYGGGEILIGGDYRGSNPEIPNALGTFVDEQVILKADATLYGDGGKVIVWGDQGTFYRGQSFVRGGEEGGDGGLTEVSGKFLSFQGTADSSAAFGKTGTLLLDPTDITIAAADANQTFAASAPTPPCTGLQILNFIGTPATATVSSLAGSNLITLLATNCVTLNTSAPGSGTGTNGGSITVTDAVSWSADTTLTLQADTSIAVNNNIINSSATTGFNAIVLANVGTTSTVGNPEYSGITTATGVKLTTVGGNISLNGQAFSTTASATPFNGVTVTGGAGSTISSSGGGNITIIGSAAVNAGAVGSVNNGVAIGGSGFTISTTGTGNIAITGSGGTLTGGNNIGITMNGVLSVASGTATLIGTGDAASLGGSNEGVSINGTVETTAGGTITITGIAGGLQLTSGVDNFGIEVNAIAQFKALSGGTISLTGTGGGLFTSATTAENLGISFGASGVGATINLQNGATMSMNGIGGSSGFAAGNETRGLVFTGLTNLTLLNGSTLSVSGTGGHQPRDNLQGVLWEGPISSYDVDATSTVQFVNSIGGTSIPSPPPGGETNGATVGVDIDADLTLTTSGGAVSGNILFCNIQGGDTTLNTTGNIGLSTNAGTISALRIIGTNISGGGSTATNSAAAANRGMTVNSTIGAVGATETISFTNVTGGPGGGENVGIFVTDIASFIVDSGGTLTLGGTGGGQGALFPSGGNHGVQFQAGSTLTIGSTGAASAVISGVGGSGVALATNGNHGVLMQGTVELLNGSSLTFGPSSTTSACTGGTITTPICAGGTNTPNGNCIGVLWNVPLVDFTDSPGASINFNGVVGGSSGTVGGLGNNYGVEISTTGLEFANPSTTLSFSNVTGGDSGKGTPSNHGVFINNVPVTAATITGSNINSGQGKVNNIGFHLSGAGAIMGSGITTSISITAASKGVATGEVGVQMDTGSEIALSGNATLSLSGTTFSPSDTAGNFGVSITDAASEIIGANGSITILSPKSSIFLGNGITISSTSASPLIPILVKADVDIVEKGGFTMTTLGGPIQLVVDNAFPNPPGIGPGIFNMPDTAAAPVTITTNGGLLQLWGGVLNSGIFPTASATLNGALYVQGLFQREPIYFPTSINPVGDPYFVYYKTIVPGVLAKAVNNFSIAISEAFQTWAYNWYRDYLDQDRYPPAYTPKGLNIIIPSLVTFNSTQQQSIPVENTSPKRYY